MIAAFTFLFLLYSGAAFVRFRMKEFGLLTMLGLTRRQLVRMILWENLIVAASALTIGLGMGLLFLKLFFMAISALLRLPEELPFYAGAPVWIQTIAVFGSFFTVVSLVSLRGVLRQNIVDLIRARQKPKASPGFSLWKAIAGLGLVAVGYAWASRPNPMEIILGVIPVTTMVSLGTYLLLKEGSIAILSRLHRWDRFFYRPRPFLVVSQLIFKMQDNYRVLSAVSLLIAEILSAMGTIYTLYIVIADDALTRAPQALQIVLSPGDDVERKAASVQEILVRHGVDGLVQVRMDLLEATLGEQTVYLVPSSLYERLYRPQGKTLPVDDESQGVLIYPYVVPASQMEGRGRPLFSRNVMTGERPLTVGGEALTLSVVPDLSGRLLNEPIGDPYTFVVADETFERFGVQPGVERLPVVVWTGSTWRGKAVEAAISELKEGRVIPRDSLSTTLDRFQALVTAVGVALFIGLFVSLVFFAATCSLLYFRLFTEIDEDRRYLRRLQDVGVSERDVGRLSWLQNAIVFLVPFAVGLIHSTFAMKALGTLVMKRVIYSGWLVALGYLLVYVAYFAATDAVYRRAIGSKSPV